MPQRLVQSRLGGPGARRLFVMQKTWNAKPGEIERHWYVVDADGKTLGRLATRFNGSLT